MWAGDTVTLSPGHGRWRGLLGARCGLSECSLWCRETNAIFILLLTVSWRKNSKNKLKSQPEGKVS